MAGTSTSHGSSHGHEHGHHGAWKPLGTGALTTQDADTGLGHLMPLPVLNKVFISLIILTVVTVAASRVDFGHMNTVVAIFIATVKAALVGTFFMHLKFESKTIFMYIAYPVLLLILLVGSQVGDVLDRKNDVPIPAIKAFQPDEPVRTFTPPHHSDGDHHAEGEAGHGAENQQEAHH